MTAPIEANGQTGADPAADVQRLASVLLKRDLRPRELENWVARARRERLDFSGLFDAMLALPEYQTRAGVMPGHPPGHYYSPVVDTEELRRHFKVDRLQPIGGLRGLDLDEAALLEHFDTLAPYIAMHRFPLAKQDGERYFIENGIYPLGDAIILAAMTAHYRPQRVIEIGSGFSTACMLDAVERHGLETRFTCIEPYPDRLRRTLTPADAERVTIVEAMVQTVDPAIVETLGRGDILFIDSTHVAKTGSDVCFEIFELLPRLAPGVLVHIHDIQYPFEYPDIWIFDKRWSWNEIYMVRAFLMYNSRFRVLAFNGWLGTHHRKRIEAAYGAPVANAGGSIWMVVEG